jgi:hypothetical protein
LCCLCGRHVDDEKFAVITDFLYDRLGPKDVAMCTVRQIVSEFALRERIRAMELYEDNRLPPGIEPRSVGN